MKKLSDITWVTTLKEGHIMLGSDLAWQSGVISDWKNKTVLSNSKYNIVLYSYVNFLCFVLRSGLASLQWLSALDLKPENSLLKPVLSEDMKSVTSLEVLPILSYLPFFYRHMCACVYISIYFISISIWIYPYPYISKPKPNQNKNK